MFVEFLKSPTDKALKKIMNKLVFIKSVQFLYFVLSVFIGMSTAYAESRSFSAPVVVVAAEKTQLAPVSWVAGSVISRNDANIAAEIEGRLVSLADIGSHILKGDELAKLENLQLSFRLKEFKASVLRAEARQKFLKKEVARLKRLARNNNAARTQLEQTEADRDVAVAEYSLSRAQLEQARDMSDRQIVRAPFSGMVAQHFQQQGGWSSVGSSLLRLVDVKTLEVKAMVSLSALEFLRQGSVVDIKSGDRQVSGVVRSLASAGDQTSRLLEMRVDYEINSWLAGQTVRVAVPSAAPQSVIAVPRDALVLRRNGAAVFRVKEDKTAERVVVKTGIAQGDVIQVIGDVAEGDKIVTRGGERLRPGQKVQMLESGN